MARQSHKPLNIDTIPELLNTTEKSEFFDLFWKAWSVNGFGTLTKKDSELLIFGCLKHVLGEQGPASNYGWATLLRLTPSKIKTMRLESHLRFGHLLSDDADANVEYFLKKFTQLQSVDIRGLASTGDVQEVTVSFVIEDPVIQMLIENRLKKAGTYMDFHRNREIVRLRLIDFFKIIAQDKEQAALDQWVANKAKEKAGADSLKSRVIAREYANKSEAGKLMHFVDDLAAYGGVSKLTDHLKMIFKSQSERKSRK